MIKVQEGDIDVGAEIAKFAAGNSKVGGVCLFLGLVRDFAGECPNDGKAITSMTLEHYAGMTERKLAEIEGEARRRWPLEDVLIIHRYGRLDAGDRIVLVATASAHREDAFSASRFLIDWLKTKAPFWKLEHSDASEAWVMAREGDLLCAAQWET